MLLGCGSPEKATPDTEWHLSTWGNPRAVTTAIEEVARRVEKDSDGSFVIKVHFGEAVSPSRQNLESLSIGLVDAAQTCASYHPGKTPAMTALELPFLPIEGLEHTIAVHEAFYELPVVERELSDWNAQFLFLVPTPQPEFMGSGQPPRTLEDWNGMRVRATGGLGHAMSELGAAPVGVPPPEVYIGLERGLFSAAAFPYSYAFGAYRLFEVSDWYTTNMRAAGFNCPVLVNRDSYDDLSQRERAILKDAIDHAYKAQLRGLAEADAQWLPTFEQEGLEPITYDEELLSAFRRTAAEPVWERWRDTMTRKDIDGDNLLEALLSMIAKTRKEAEPNP